MKSAGSQSSGGAAGDDLRPVGERADYVYAFGDRPWDGDSVPLSSCVGMCVQLGHVSALLVAMRDWTPTSERVDRTETRVSSTPCSI